MIRLSIILILFFSCNSSNTKNFIELKNAYYKWYEKNHTFTQSNYSENQISDIDYKVVEEKIYDLKRFELELSQISKSQLKYSLEIDYEIILNHINRLLFNYDYKENQQFSINQYLFKIYKSLFKILNDNQLMTFEKISFIKQQISYINNSFEMINERDIDFTKKDLKQINLQIDSLVALFDNLPILLNLDINNYNQLNDILKKTKNKVNKYKYMINYEIDYIHKNVHSDFLIKKNIYEFHSDNIFKNSDFNRETIYKFISSNIMMLQSQIFDECLIIYTSNNDEPVWVDKQDTLNVINYVLDNNFKKNTFDKKKLISEIFNEYSTINKSIQLLDLDNYFINENIEFSTMEDYHMVNSFLDVTLNTCIVNTDFDINYNQYILRNYLFKYLIPNTILYNSISLNENKIRSIYNKNYNLALAKFLNYVIVNNFYKNDSLYKLHFYLNLLRTNLQILNQDNYINNKTVDEDIVENFIKNGYMNKTESRILLEELKSLETIYIVDYLMYLHFINLYDKNCIINQKYSPGQLFDKIIKSGTIPFYYNN